MDLLSSDIKVSLQPKTTEEGHDNTLPTNIDCCLSKINQALKTIENALFSDYEHNENTLNNFIKHDDNMDITTEDKVKLLTARVESLEQQLVLKKYELQATQEELKSTNEDLIAALKPDILTQAEAKELAQNVLASKGSIHESLAKLLSGIYNTKIEASELAPINNYNNREDSLNIQIDRLKSMHKALKQESTALKSESVSVRNRVAELKALSQDIITRTATLKNK
ncbi:hypothetical protein RIVM261_057170 [Rivularia sp. IAM M-261]|nr:hypothetical protein RIVM261_057170 [Rivularia sp. IAM M-261]